MSRIVLIMLVVITCLALFPVGLVCATTVTLNGETLQFDIPPTVENGRTLVPMRAISEALGASVIWSMNF